MVDNSNPPTFWNRIRTESFVLFLSMSPKRSLFSFLFSCTLVDVMIGDEGLVGVFENDWIDTSWELLMA